MQEGSQQQDDARAFCLGVGESPDSTPRGTPLLLEGMMHLISVEGALWPQLGEGLEGSERSVEVVEALGMMSRIQIPTHVVHLKLM